MIEATTATFDELVKGSEGAVIADFWATWCGPCRPLRRSLEKIAENHTIITVNADEEPEILRRYSVMSLPTLIAFKDGKEKERWVGWRGDRYLLRALEPYSAAGHAT